MSNNVFSFSNQKSANDWAKRITDAFKGYKDEILGGTFRKAASIFNLRIATATVLTSTVFMQAPPAMARAIQEIHAQLEAQATPTKSPVMDSGFKAATRPTWSGETLAPKGPAIV